jgi:hypothetical protein
MCGVRVQPPPALPVAVPAAFVNGQDGEWLRAHTNDELVVLLLPPNDGPWQSLLSSAGLTILVPAPTLRCAACSVVQCGTQLSLADGCGRRLCCVRRRRCGCCAAGGLLRPGAKCDVSRTHKSKPFPRCAREGPRWPWTQRTTRVLCVSTTTPTASCCGCCPAGVLAPLMLPSCDACDTR